MSESLRAPRVASGDAADSALGHVAAGIAASMIHGGYEERSRAFSLAHDVEREVDGFIERVKAAIDRLGGDSWTWVAPVHQVDEPKPSLKVPALRDALAQHIAGAYVSGSDDQVARAQELETALDGSGLNVDKKVDSIVLEMARSLPSRRGTGGRVDSHPF